jgi:hypothetical protein
MGEGGISTIEMGVLAKTGCGADTIGVGAGAGADTAFAAMLGSALKISGNTGIGVESRLEGSLGECTLPLLDGEPTGGSGGDWGGVNVFESVRE